MIITCTLHDFTIYKSISFNKESFSPDARGRQASFLARTRRKGIPKLLGRSLTGSQAGGLAGTAVDLLLFPIDTIKTRLQSSRGFVRAGLFKGIYKGVGSVLVGSAPGGEPSHFISSQDSFDFVGQQRLYFFQRMKL
jgi:hypothetical protein